MSIVGTLKKTEAKVAELRGELETANGRVAELEAAAEVVKVEHEAAVKAHGEAIAAKDEEIAAKVAEIEKAQADMKEQAEKSEALEKELSDAKAQCEKLEQALADPAYAAAAATGESAVDGSGEAGEESDPHAAWQKIEDRKERRAYFLAHKKEILEAYNK